MSNVERIQMQLRSSAAAIFETESTSPFTCYFNPDDAAPHANFAIPDENPSGDLVSSLDQLVATFRRRGRRPRFEYLEPYAPDLGELLKRYGFELEMRTALKICTPQTVRNAPTIQGLDIRRLGDGASSTDIQAFVTVQRRAFGDENAPAATAEEAEQFRQRFRSVQIFLAQLDSEPVGAGSLTQPDNGIAEVAGISTASAVRRRGIAAAVTEYIARTGFESGLDTLFLTAADERAGRVYERVGFVPSGSALAYILPA